MTIKFSNIMANVGFLQEVFRCLTDAIIFLLSSSHADVAVASLAFEILRTAGHENLKMTK